MPSLQQRTCEDCGATFEGGYAARFCPSCRVKRRQARQRIPIDPIRCEHCGVIVTNPYRGGQRFCKDCSPLNKSGHLDTVRIPTTRRCRNKMCIERFVPVNQQHWYHEPACAQSEMLWSVEEILAEEGALLPGGSHLELAKAAFGQKNQALRENTRLRSLREYLTFEVRNFYDEQPQYRYPAIPPPPKQTGKKHPREIIVQLSDWQIGKWEAGFGVEATKQRVYRVMEAVEAIVQRQRDAGFPVHRIINSWGGDGIEGCFIYAGQNVTGLDRTSNTHRISRQIQTLAHLMAECSAIEARFVDEVVNEVVGGNHGRTNGKNDYADPEDNFDVMAGWWASDLTSAEQRIKWHVHEDWWGGFESMGHYIVSFHGDQWRGDVTMLRRLLPGWITAGVFGRKPRIVLTHHRHELDVLDVNGVKVYQNGTIDGGSNWYLKSFGRTSTPGQRIIVMSESHADESAWETDF